MCTAPFPQRREKLALQIERDGYINQLLQIFHICEDLENLDGLHHLYEIFKSLFMFNSASLLHVRGGEEGGRMGGGRREEGRPGRGEGRKGMKER